VGDKSVPAMYTRIEKADIWETSSCER